MTSLIGDGPFQRHRHDSAGLPGRGRFAGRSVLMRVMASRPAQSDSAHGLDDKILSEIRASLDPIKRAAYF